MKRSWIVAGILGVVSAIVYFASLADYAFPGTSAHLMAVWQGLDTVAQVQYPLMRVFAILLGGGLFGPNNDCTRAQIVTFLYRLCAKA